MSRDDAHSLLNAARLGEPVSLPAITRALRMTGDLGPRTTKDEAPPVAPASIFAEQQT